MNVTFEVLSQRSNSIPEEYADHPLIAGRSPHRVAADVFVALGAVLRAVPDLRPAIGAIARFAAEPSDVIGAGVLIKHGPSKHFARNWATPVSFRRQKR